MSNLGKRIGVILLILAAGLLGYLAGSRRSGEPEAQSSETFYAVIEEIKDSVLLVQGMDVNDINFRGEFYLTLSEKTELTWRYTEISSAELAAGDRISVTFTGEVMETAPAQIQEVLRIQLLEDEKGEE
jgi:hypothetical protein